MRRTVQIARMKLPENRNPFITAPTSMNVDEGNNAVVTVTSTKRFTSDTAIYYRLIPQGGAVAGVDYTDVASPLILPKGQLTVNLTIPILDDAVVDPIESVKVQWLRVVAL
jgi:hypothetical protein